MATLFSSTFPAANFSEYDGTYESGNTNLDNPAGRSTYCGMIDCYGSGESSYWKVVSSLSAGTHVKAEMYFKLATDLDAATERVMFRMWNNVSGAGISLLLDFDAVGGNRRLWLGNTDGDGFYSTNRYSFSTWTKITIYAYLDATAGKLRLEVADVDNGEDTSVITLPNGSIDRFTWRFNWATASYSAQTYWDDVAVTDEGYSGWAATTYGSPLRRGLIAPFHNDQRNARGQTAKWPANLEWKH